MHHIQKLWYSPQDYGRYDEAISNLEQAIELASKCSILAHVVYTVELATVYSLKGEHAVALELIADVDYERIKGYKDSFAELLYLYSDIYIRSGDAQGALEWFSRAEKLCEQCAPSKQTSLYDKREQSRALIQGIEV